MNTPTLASTILKSIGAAFVKAVEQPTREPLPYSLRALLRSIEAKEKLERERQLDAILSTAWQCQTCGDITENAQPTFRPIPCPLCSGIYFTALRTDA